MNLDNNPTVEELRDLLCQCDDQAGRHMLWVSRTGEVHVSRIPKDQSPVGFEREHPEMQLRYETFEAGNEYVGPEAADDESWVGELFDGLLKQWAKVKGRPAVEYVGQL